MNDFETAQIAPAPAVRLRRSALWRNKPFTLLFVGTTLSTFGGSFHSIALNLWVLNTTGSAKMMSVLLVMNLALSSLLGPVAGTLADRLNRRTLMLWSNAIRALVVGLMAIAIAIPDMPFIAVVLLSVFVTAAGLVQSPAFNASITTIVGKEHIQQATGVMSLSENISRTVGFGVGGVIVAAFGGPAAIAVDAATFLVAFLLIIAAGPFNGSPMQAIKEQKAPANFKAQFVMGLKYIWRDPIAKSVMLMSPILTLFFMCALMLTQVMAVKVWHATPFQFGLFEACIPLGYMLGAGVIVMLDKRLLHRGKLIMASLMMMGPLYMLLSAMTSAALAIPVILALGFMYAFCTVLINIILRLEVSEELQGRVFGTLGSFMSVTPSIGLVIASYAADRYGAGAVVFVIGLLLSLFGIAALLSFKHIRKYN